MTDIHPSLTSLSRDILLIVFDLLHDTSPESLKAVALVSRNFLPLADYARHKSLTLRLGHSHDNGAKDRLRYIEKHNLFSAIRTLRVECFRDDYYVDRNSSSASDNTTDSLNYVHDPTIKTIAASVSLMPALSDVIWNYNTSSVQSMPDLVFQAIYSRPDVRLHTVVSGFGYAFHHRGRDRPKTCIVDNLMSTPYLKSINVDVEFTDANDCLATTAPLKQILLSSPYLRSLSLSIKQPTRGCIRYAEPTTYCGLGFAGTESMPPLHELKITHYPWGYPWNGYPGQEWEPQHWAQEFNWSLLRRFETRDPEIAWSFISYLTALREMHFHWCRDIGDIGSFFLACPTLLQAISAPGLAAVTLDGIRRHGKTLRKLRLHPIVAFDSDQTHRPVDGDSLRIICDSCPLIEELFIDIDRDGDWPWESLKLLATLPRLKYLTICFHLCDKRNRHATKPYVTFSSVRTLFEFLRSSSPRQPSILTRLHVYCGGLLNERPRRFHLSTEDNSTEFICTLSERDDEAAKNVCEVICPRLRKQLQRGDLLPPEFAEGSFLAEVQRDLYVALYGPD